MDAKLQAAPPLFNLHTMSGIFPGSRTKTFQRMRLRPYPPIAGDRPFRWALLLWDDERSTSRLHLQKAGDGVTFGEWDKVPLLEIERPQLDFSRRLQRELHELGWQIVSCGSCNFFQPVADAESDNLPIGQCSQTEPSRSITEALRLLTEQSALALSCPKWVAFGAGVEVQSELKAGAKAEAQIEEEATGMGWGAKLRRRFFPQLRPDQQKNQPQAWSEKFVERSGVGAGTDPCFACHGRIANLGALTVETDEGDTHTFSVWRCRVCYTYTLNSWIDRWERLDTLETEESIYRITPAEAFGLLEEIAQLSGGEHPGRRHERKVQRDRFYQFIQERPMLSHQIKHGR